MGVEIYGGRACQEIVADVDVVCCVWIEVGESGTVKKAFKVNIKISEQASTSCS